MPEHQCRPIQHFEAALDIPDGRNQELLVSRLNAAFDDAAIAAASDRESINRGDTPTQLMIRESSLKKWADEGKREVQGKVLDKQLDMGWAYSMLELLKCLAIACDSKHGGKKGDRKTYLLVRVHLPSFLTRAAALDEISAHRQSGQSLTYWPGVMCVKSPRRG